MRYPKVFHFLFFTWLIGMTITASAQTAQVTGRISDPSGAVVPGAQITVTHVATGINRESVSNSEGFFTIRGEERWL
jgi:hypothetical protein